MTLKYKNFEKFYRDALGWAQSVDCGMSLGRWFELWVKLYQENPVDGYPRDLAFTDDDIDFVCKTTNDGFFAIELVRDLSTSEYKRLGGYDDYADYDLLNNTVTFALYYRCDGKKPDFFWMKHKYKENVSNFTDAVFNSDGFKAVKDLKPVKVEIEFN